MIAERRLLVIDDEPVVCESCDRIFSNQGFQVDSISNSEEGLELASQNRYAAILLDIQMPNLNGLEFLRRLRGRNVEAPVMMMTGYPSVPSAAQSMRLGASDYIAKPFTPDSILNAVNRIFEADSSDEAAAMQKSEAPDDSAEALRFFANSWVSAEADGLIAAGALVSPRHGVAIEDARWPNVGERVFQGLPYASVRWEDGVEERVPAPLSGVVKAVNPALLSSPEVALGRPDETRWIAQIEPCGSGTEQQRLMSRTVILASRDFEGETSHADALRACGCKVIYADSSASVIERYRQGATPLVWWDARSFGDEGPGELEALFTEIEHARVFVNSASPDIDEAAYRRLPIFYFGVDPMDDSERIAALNSAFNAEPAWQAPRSNDPLPSAINSIVVGAADGTETMLMSSGSVLLRNEGIGAWLMDRILHAGCPLQATYGARIHTPSEWLKNAQRYQRVIVLEAELGSRIPGSIRFKQNAPGEFTTSGNGIIRIFVQGDLAGGGTLHFSDRINMAIANHVFDAMMNGKPDAR